MRTRLLIQVSHTLQCPISIGYRLIADRAWEKGAFPKLTFARFVAARSREPSTQHDPELLEPAPELGARDPGDLEGVRHGPRARAEGELHALERLLVLEREDEPVLGER